MNFFQSTGSGTLLLLSGTSGRLSHHSSLANEDDVTVGKLLFEFTSESALNFVEGLDLRNRYEDHNRLATTLDLNLTRSTDLERAEFSVQVRDVGLQVEDSLGNHELGLIGGGTRSVGRSQNLGLGGHCGRCGDD